jgi:hypothetical protein
MFRLLRLTCLLLPLAVPLCSQDTAADLQSIVERLERLERENASLRDRVARLETELAGARPGPAPRLEETVAVHDARLREHEQSKIGTSQRFPLRVSGMALFNLYTNSAGSNGADNPVLAAPDAGRRGWGGTFRQSIVGLDFHGPQTIWNGRVRGSLSMDFFAGSSQVLNNLMRIRTATVEIEWKNRSVLAGIEKPLFAPRNPTSYAQVGVSPLTAAGNLWRWQPQVRFEQRLPLGNSAGLRAQTAFIQTSEELTEANRYAPGAPPNGSAGAPYGADSGLLQAELRRPGIEGRVEFWRRIDDTRRIEIAPGFHFSRSHLLGRSLPSSLFSLDWFLNPWSKLEVSGAFFTGQNINHFGAPNLGYTWRGRPWFIPVHSRGGWAQFSVLATSRLSFNFFGGQHDDRNRDLRPGDVGKNRAEGANIHYRLAPNVILSLEAMQVRTSYLGEGRSLNNHYDLGLAYLF